MRDWGFGDEGDGRKKADPVSSPAHYLQGQVEVTPAIMALGPLDFCEGNVVKYVCRHRHKNGIEDLKKAQAYLRMMIENYQWYDS